MPSRTPKGRSAVASVAKPGPCNKTPTTQGPPSCTKPRPSPLHDRGQRRPLGRVAEFGLLPFHRGLWEESLSVLKRCRSVATSAEEKAEVLVAEGTVLVSLCRWDEGVESWERALALASDGSRAALAHRVYLGRAVCSTPWATTGWRSPGRESHRVRARTAAPTRAMALNGAGILACLRANTTGRAPDQRGAAAGRLLSLRILGCSHPDEQAACCAGRWDYRNRDHQVPGGSGSGSEHRRDAEQAYGAGRDVG